MRSIPPIPILAAAAFALAAVSSAQAQMVWPQEAAAEAAMAPPAPGRTVMETAAGSPDHEALSVTARVSGLDRTLAMAGPYTVFAPTDEAFAELRPNAVADLLRPENREILREVLGCHVAPGRALSAGLLEQAAREGGELRVKTLGGCILRLRGRDGHLEIEDERGRIARVTVADVAPENGVVHVIDHVLLPDA